MSGWIKWTKDLETDSRVTRMARELKRRNATRNAETTESVTHSVTCSVTSSVTALTTIVGALVRFWSHADSHVRADDTLDMSLDEIDEHVGVPGFAASLPTDWLIVIDDHTVELPSFQEHNGLVAKKQALNAKRQSNYRTRTSVTGSNAPALRGGVGGALPRPDQTRPDHKEPEPHSRRGDEGETETPEPKRRRRVNPAPFDPSKIAGLDIGAWNAWLQYRAERKPAIKACSMEAAAQELAGFGAQQAAVVRHSKANGYQGLVSPHKVNGHGAASPDPEVDAISKLKARRSSMPALRDFRDPLPNETAKAYRQAQDVEFQRHQDAQHAPRATVANAEHRDVASLARIATKAMP